MIAAANLFLDPKWVYALLLVVIFIVFYLIRPKPRQKTIPTLMFLFRDKGSNRTSNLFRHLITNLLFILQLMILLLVVLSIAKPYLNVAKESLFKNTVIVLDVSSSMKAPYQGGTRFKEAVELAKDNLGSINTLVVAKKTPEAVLVDESAGKVNDYLSKLKPTDNPTDLYGALAAAGGYAKPDSRIVVLSDFIDTETDTDLNTLKKTLEAQGIKVDFIRLFSAVPNIGIVDLSITESKTSAVIRNYNAGEAEVNLKIGNINENLKIPGDSKELFSFTTPAGTSKLEMKLVKGNDEFEIDNVAYISAPSDVKKRVLYITNNAGYSKNYLYNALMVMKNIYVEVAVPPKIPDLGSYDIYIFKDVNPSLILPGAFKGAKKESEERGKAVIIAAQTDIRSIDYQGLLPVTLGEEVKETINILPGTSDSITSNVELGITKMYFLANTTTQNPAFKTAVIAASDSGNPLVTFSALGEGKVVYYGILDEDKTAESIFGKSPSYFVFWKRTVDYVTNTPSIKNINYKAGSYMSFSEQQTIQTPGGRITTDELALDNAGLYTLKDRTIAINLIDEKESDISYEAATSASGADGGERFKEKIAYELTDLFIIAALVLLYIELLYVKMRGDF